MNKSIFVLIVGLLCLAIWLSLYMLSYSNMYIKNKLTLVMSSTFGLPVSYSYSIFATIIYCILPLAGCFIIGEAAGFSFVSIFSIGWNTLLVALMAVIGVMSTMAVFLMVILTISPKMNIQGEMSKIKWIEGIFMVPTKVAWLLPMCSACFEEVFFRGAFLNGLLVSGMDTLFAICIVTIAFVINQCILADTKTQKLILGVSSLVISVIGSLAFLACGSIIPSMIMHASFAGFYTSGKK